MMKSLPFLLLFVFSTLCADDPFYSYDYNEDVKGFLPSEFYREAVSNLPICCVDIFLYSPNTDSYLLVKRKDEPAKGMFWCPGGRLNKGESFFECAERKIRDETSLSAKPITVVGVYSTAFSTSAWGCPSHTVNIGVLALCDDAAPALDAHHDTYRWMPLNTRPGDDPYLGALYDAAIQLIMTK